jgi:phthalate 4,5-dioxygenase
MEQGEMPLMVLDTAAAAGVTGPATMDGIGPTEGWERYWPEVDRRRREGAPWAQVAAE